MDHKKFKICYLPRKKTLIVSKENFCLDFCKYTSRISSEKLVIFHTFFVTPFNGVFFWYLQNRPQNQSAVTHTQIFAKKCFDLRFKHNTRIGTLRPSTYQRLLHDMQNVLSIILARKNSTVSCCSSTSRLRLSGCLHFAVIYKNISLSLSLPVFLPLF